MWRILICLLGSGLACQLFGQSSPVRFEVASIKPSSRGDRVLLNPQPDGGLRAISVTPRMLITMAYGILDSQLVRGPRWMDSEVTTSRLKPSSPKGRRSIPTL